VVTRVCGRSVRLYLGERVLWREFDVVCKRPIYFSVNNRI